MITNIVCAATIILSALSFYSSQPFVIHRSSIERIKRKNTYSYILVVQYKRKYVHVKIHRNKTVGVMTTAGWLTWEDIDYSIARGMKYRKYKPGTIIQPGVNVMK